MKTELSFDEKGYLIPCKEIETNMETLKKYFVDAFPSSQTAPNDTPNVFLQITPSVDAH